MGNNKKVKIDDSYSAHMGCTSIPIGQVSPLLTSIALDPDLRFKILVNLVSRAGFGKTYSVLEAAYNTYVALLFNSELNPKMKAKELYNKKGLVVPNKEESARIVKEYKVEKFNDHLLYQEARNIKFKVTIMMTSQKLPEDFAGIPMYDPEKDIMRQIPLSELPQDPEVFYYLFLDEINRTDPAVLKPTFQLLGQRRIGEHELPLSCVLVSAMNPDTGGYDVTSLEPAITRRLCFIEVTNNYNNWLDWAKENDIHEVVKTYILNNKEKLFDEIAHEKGGVFSNPASWVKVSLLLQKYKPSQSKFLIPLISGYIGNDIATEIVKIYNDKFTESLRVNDVLINYTEKRPKVLSLISKGKVAGIAVSVEKIVSTFCLTYKRDETTQNKYISNLATFLGDIPPDILTTCLHNFSSTFEEITSSDSSNKGEIEIFKNKFYKKIFDTPTVKKAAQEIHSKSQL